MQNYSWAGFFSRIMMANRLVKVTTVEYPCKLYDKLSLKQKVVKMPNSGENGQNDHAIT